MTDLPASNATLTTDNFGMNRSVNFVNDERQATFVEHHWLATRTLVGRQWSLFSICQKGSHSIEYRFSDSGVSSLLTYILWNQESPKHVAWKCG
jgi:hypothetical protein